MASITWNSVAADSISHPDGSSKSPLYVSGIVLDQASSAASNVLNINSTTGELQSNDQGTTRPISAKAALIDNVSGTSKAVLASTWTQLDNVVWPDYTHKVTDISDYASGDTAAAQFLEYGPQVVNVTFAANTATYVAIGLGSGEFDYVFSKKSGDDFARSFVTEPDKFFVADPWIWTDAASTVFITVNTVGYGNHPIGRVPA